MRDVQKRSKARTVRSSTSVDSVQETRSVNLQVAGQRLSIRTDKDEAYLQQLAEHVSDCIEELKKGTRSASTHQLYLLAALNLADELFQAQDKAEGLRDEVQRRTERLIRMLDSADPDDDRA